MTVVLPLRRRKETVELQCVKSACTNVLLLRNHREHFNELHRMFPSNSTMVYVADSWPCSALPLPASALDELLNVMQRPQSVEDAAELIWNEALVCCCFLMDSLLMLPFFFVCLQLASSGTMPCPSSTSSTSCLFHCLRSPPAQQCWVSSIVQPSVNFMRLMALASATAWKLSQKVDLPCCSFFFFF